MKLRKKSNEKFMALEQKMNYHFADPSLLVHALSHSSYANEMRLSKDKNNERLEFLGDAVLELVTSEYVYKEYPDLSEGDLTKLRASIVCEQTLSACARDFHLGEYLLLGKGEANSGGRDRDSILSDAFEAVIGAIYLDGGFTNAKEFITQFILEDVKNKDLFFDSKTILQEIIQNENNKQKLRYNLISETGPDHNKIFTIAVCIGNEEIGRGSGRTKKAAEQEAANQAIQKLQKN
ncbi:ribonuclease III [Lachnospiraceae bacterium MD1]|jgi:ribonuclease-3|uniref:Ribonuclease 3 n=1 Tax=Variimorphobacter saccharofermentans TaxID=2755051 RepID=A0A839JZB9_9FIRM|nr:ribonuclease III [Variimorphobacter saccharofermentans]MBB2183025.1 ribonuclease III [Variimorphobacter saccharofermentans]